MAKFCTINVKGLRDLNKRLSFLQWLSNIDADFVALQETHAVSCDEASSWFSCFGFDVVSSPGSARSCGVALLFRAKYSIIKTCFDKSGRFIQAEFTIDGITFSVVCVYSPNLKPDRDVFFRFVTDKVNPATPTVILGDFNAVFDRTMDRRGSGTVDVSRESFLALKSLFDDCCVVDVWRHLHPRDRSFTWMRPDGAMASRIDLVGCPFSWLHHVDDCQILPCPFSDHSLVLLSCRLPFPLPRGPGRWKLNVSLMNDVDFVSSVRNFWFAWRLRKYTFPSLQLWWDRGKSLLKGLAIRFSCRLAEKRLSSRSILSRLHIHLKDLIDGGSISLLPVFQNVSSSIANLDLHEAEGARVRARVRWAEEGETSTKYFFRLERKRGTDSWISAMRSPDGNILTELNDICTSWVTYYEELFSASPVDLFVQATLLGRLNQSLPTSLSCLCEGLLSCEEAFAALKGMARGKSPGSDGLPVEFYLKFWDILGSDLVDVLNASYQSGLLPFSQREALISLIFKKGDRLLHKNWRPISLLNVDYKLCARAIAGRLLKVLHHVIHRDQTCGVKGRFIGENIALLRDLISYVNESGYPLAILSLDQEKAFDRVDWDCLFNTLQCMGFGPSFTSWVRLFYSDIRSAICINGYLSNYFKPSRGVRQGCPLSPLLYVISIEVLACSLRAHPALSGLRLPNIPDPIPTLSLYADDTSVISSSDVATLAIFSVYNNFELGTGAKLNLEKCEGLWLGRWIGRTDAPVPIQWTSKKIKVLGVFLGNGDLESFNWRPRVDAVSRCLAAWRSRHLSYSGRALVANALALSKIWYLASVIPIPSWVVSELNSLLFNFFWGGKRDLVSRAVVVQPKHLGGFAVVSIQFKVRSLLVQWIRRFSCSPAGWVSLLTFWFFDRFGVSPSVVFSYPSYFSSVLLPPFYESLLNAWVAIDGSCLGARLVAGSRTTSPIDVESLTCKDCYSLFLSLNLSVPHCVSKFDPFFPSLEWSSTWSSLFFFPIDRPIIDLNWKIAHGVLYTADRLVSFGINVPLACFCGDPVETPDHLFFDCRLAQEGIGWIQSLLSLSSPNAPVLSLRHILFGFTSLEYRSVPKVFGYILNVFKYFIWTQRNAFRFDSIQPCGIRLLSSIKARLRFYLPVFFKRFKSSRRRTLFIRQWGAGGLIGSARGDDFEIVF